MKIYYLLVISAWFSIVSVKAQTVGEVLKRATIKFNKEDFIGAVQDFTLILETIPNYVSGYTKRGLASLYLFRSQEAIKDFTKAIELDSNYFDAYVLRGFTYEKRNDWQLAAADFRKALQIRPFDESTKLSLARVEGYIQKKRVPKIWIVSVGIDTYKYPQMLTPLRWSVNNALRFTSTFTRVNLCPEEQIKILFNAQASKENILQSIQSILCDPAKVFPEDMVIFYFVGHGTILPNSFGICPYDYYNGKILISEADILTALGKSPAIQRICLIESCKSESVKMQANDSPELLQLYNNTRKQYPATTIFFTSTKVGSASIEDPEIGGIFSHYLIAGLKGKADGFKSDKKDNLITIRELYNYVKENVIINTNGEQVKYSLFLRPRAVLVR